ncbi:cytochrome b-c1 complex subunit 8 isoform X1 [Dendrobium catenatum]|uniref:cytochrome b-c1 complex subunit 8 isoform X1 n=1 Tax=Dendrobium catenatum TaxID=906689 RepID=UPI0010A0B2E5|nr:cytochrome b-c1 complex subunit 8 isoform X1 [Dendrobium catenatum]
MGKTPVRMKAVVYSLSPFQQKVMPGLWKDLTTKIHHKVSDNWLSATLLLGPLIGTYCGSFGYPIGESLNGFFGAMRSSGSMLHPRIFTMLCARSFNM